MRCKPALSRGRFQEEQCRAGHRAAEKAAVRKRDQLAVALLPGIIRHWPHWPDGRSYAAEPDAERRMPSHDAGMVGFINNSWTRFRVIC